ncbi:MAG: MoaD/ThiS family protein [Thermogemmata sp.]|jgi:molybdopterin converting factor subunit 1|uniref:Molybdopterin synthase sulfur carrier subunit n=1 Tax=Thermogemmata fonticola TaxID=2755323 RepID=A0A7V8VE85_9BACT|nr:MoaD/ThiS family protein [Thermogemmata fonticola]MBA2226331.1 MoaD/ThiS family protein [Thermogemmata fonticola]MCX8139987.1 MoaD/ThiS family protein [Gemmataceae bacterium]
MTQVLVHLRLFAVFRDTLGADLIPVELPAGSTVADLRQALYCRWPTLRNLLERSAIAINQEYASDNHVLSSGDEAALIPPVSGGQPFSPIP